MMSLYMVSIFNVLSVIEMLCVDGLEDTNGPLIVELQKPQGASLGISLSGMRKHENVDLIFVFLDDRISGQPIVISRVREAGIADRYVNKFYYK